MFSFCLTKYCSILPLLLLSFVWILNLTIYTAIYSLWRCGTLSSIVSCFSPSSFTSVLCAFSCIVCVYGLWYTMRNCSRLFGDLILFFCHSIRKPAAVYQLRNRYMQRCSATEMKDESSSVFFQKFFLPCLPSTFKCNQQKKGSTSIQSMRYPILAMCTLHSYRCEMVFYSIENPKKNIWNNWI